MMEAFTYIYKTMNSMFAYFHFPPMHHNTYFSVNTSSSLFISNTNFDFFSWFPYMTLFVLTAATYLMSNLLLFLLNLEVMMMMSILTVVSMSNSMNITFIMMSMLLVVSVCEASVGLACLVSMVRSYGSDTLKALLKL